MPRPTIIACVLLSLLPKSALAQGATPPLSYGYQPYNDKNPTGFNHPSNMGYGYYVYSRKFTGHSASALRYRRFKGY